MNTPRFSTWRTSTRSGNQGNCVEVALSTDGTSVGVRDSKDRIGGTLVVSRSAWTGFVNSIQTGTFDQI